MPLDRNPKAAKPWVPDLLFEPVARPAPAPVTRPSPEENPVVLAPATAAAVQEPAPQSVERPESLERPAPQASAVPDSDDPAELRRVLGEQEKALNKVRIVRRNFQEEIAKARRAFMFAERTRVYSAKGALDALIAQEQQSEIEERRLASEILEARARLERLSRSV